jgi:chemotaxis regulatin CheY-phosphate phosphatase CheZ
MSISTSVQGVIQREITMLSESIGGLMDTLNHLKHPIAESHDKVPQATNQLDKISQQTEAATNRMLDVLEQITQREQQIITGLKTIESTVGGQQVVVELKNLAELANTNMNDAYTVMDALQFQDITSQQMDHAASLLEEIEGKLKNILNVIGEEGEDQVSKQNATTKKQRSYDPHADLFDKKTQQADIDSLFAKTNKK